MERNGVGILNFNVKAMCKTSKKSYITRGALKDAVQELFDGDSEIAVFYYVSHGSYDMVGGYLCTSEVKRVDDGLSLDDVIENV